jgi:hypothetical protein
LISSYWFADCLAPAACPTPARFGRFARWLRKLDLNKTISQSAPVCAAVGWGEYSLKSTSLDPGAARPEPALRPALEESLVGSWRSAQRRRASAIRHLAILSSVIVPLLPHPDSDPDADPKLYIAWLGHHAPGLGISDKLPCPQASLTLRRPAPQPYGD